MTKYHSRPIIKAAHTSALHLITRKAAGKSHSSSIVKSPSESGVPPNSGARGGGLSSYLAFTTVLYLEMKTSPMSPGIPRIHKRVV